MQQASEMFATTPNVASETLIEEAAFNGTKHERRLPRPI